MRVQGILFDLDDTLTDRKATFPVYAKRFLQTFGSQLGEVSAETIAQAILKADAGGYRREEERYSELLEVLPWRERPTIAVLERHWTTDFARCAVPVEGMAAVLDELRARGLRLGVITNGGVERQTNKIEHLELRPWMDTVLVSGAVGIHKPDPRIFQRAVADLQLAPEQVWFVGDHPVNDIIGAVGAGLTPVWRRGCHAWPTDRPEPALQYERLPELIALLDRFAAEGK